jgi:hypothetical protein
MGWTGGGGGVGGGGGKNLIYLSAKSLRGSRYTQHSVGAVTFIHSLHVLYCAFQRCCTLYAVRVDPQLSRHRPYITDDVCCCRALCMLLYISLLQIPKMLFRVQSTIILRCLRQ